MMLRRALRCGNAAVGGRHGLLATSARGLASSATSSEYDYVIVGAGSAGCVLANRLSAILATSDRNRWDSVLIEMPAAVPINLADERYNWNYSRSRRSSSTTDASGFRVVECSDYNDWEANGAEGWSYADCLPYFKRSQSHQLGGDDYRGSDGPLHVVRDTQKDQPLFQAFLDAGVEAGYPFTEDLNGYQQEELDGRDGFFRQQVGFEGKKVVGIEVENNKTKAVSKILSGREVILSGGAINTPQLLMLSGEVGVPLVHHLPVVGKNMEDHIGLNLQFECKQPVTLYHATKRFPGKVLKIGYEWFTSKTGPGASPHCEVGGFIRTANPREHPIIDPKYMAEEESRVTLREIFAQNALKEFCGQGISPKESVQSDDEIDAWARKYAATEFHVSCTARMGVDDNSVVDPQRVSMDSKVSVFGNTNAPVIMIAEKAADMILGEPALPKANVPVYQAKNWQTSQRADPSNKVLLVEAGPSDRNRWDSFLIEMPAAVPINLADDRYNWNFSTERQEFLNNRRVGYPSGRVLGGSSSLNAMMYSRGHAKDYDEWQTKGAEGWSYADCLPYFKRSENHQLGGDDYRGGDGPLHTVRNTQKDQPLFQAFLDAGMQAGYPLTDNLNGYQQEGFGWHDLTIHEGKRWSTSAAFLHPVMDRDNLTVITDTYVNKTVVGIEVEDSKTKDVSKISSAKEVILSGGAINTPQVLMLSGVGDADHLKEVGVPLVHHLPAVGKNMEDHIGVNLQFACKQPVTLYNASKRYPRNVLKIGYEWLTSKTGPGASPHCEVGGFIRTAPGKQQPDLQIIFSPCAVDQGCQLREDIGHAMSGHISLMRGSSNGTLKLRSANPREHPSIDPKYMADEESRVTLRESVKLTREIFAQQAFEEFYGDGYLSKDSVQSDDEIDAWLRKYAGAEFHVSCTARMGVDDNSVVDR
ncbi:FAD/NAD(P)-binding domain [Phytophthora cactorum]|nr:FAD/NAD(P)-binding domain [Phytophthora cactorum]